MKVKIYNRSRNKLPQFETIGSAGMDLRADLEDKILLQPMERTLIPTGIYLELPQGIEAQIRARSGLAIKKGISLVNGIGTIDSDYRGEIKVIIINLSNESVEIENGERIAQMVFAQYFQPLLEEVKNVDELEDTKRGQGGFGHTGV